MALGASCFLGWVARINTHHPLPNTVGRNTLYHKSVRMASMFFAHTVSDAAKSRRKRKGDISMTEKKNQCIHCSVESCRHLKEEEGLCALESIQVAPTPMAYSGDPADESMCRSYETK